VKVGKKGLKNRVNSYYLNEITREFTLKHLETGFGGIAGR
jgi:hypothetical protein